MIVNNVCLLLIIFPFSIYLSTFCNDCPKTPTDATMILRSILFQNPKNVHGCAFFKTQFLNHGCFEQWHLFYLLRSFWSTFCYHNPHSKSKLMSKMYKCMSVISLSCRGLADGHSRLHSCLPLCIYFTLSIAFCWCFVPDDLVVSIMCFWCLDTVSGLKIYVSKHVGIVIAVNVSSLMPLIRWVLTKRVILPIKISLQHPLLSTGHPTNQGSPG